MSVYIFKFRYVCANLRLLVEMSKKDLPLFFSFVGMRQIKERFLQLLLFTNTTRTLLILFLTVSSTET